MYYPSESDPGLKRFLEDMGRYPVLSKKEEVGLLTMAQRGSVEAGKKLCRHNLRFVFGVALRYRGAGIPLLDLVNEGAMGLMRAIPRFDTTKNLKFISYAVWWIRQGILTALNEKGRVVRLSAQHEAEIRKVRTAPRRQVLGGGFVENLDGLETLRLTSTYLEANQGASQPPLSLDHPPKEDCTAPQDYLASTAPLQDEEAQSRERVQILKRLVGKLPDPQKQVVNLAFGLDGRKPMSLAEIGILIGVSRERVRQIKEKALARMRQRGRKFREGEE